jgi:hypothetical protein
MEVCPECLPLLKAAMALRDELAAVRAQITDANKKSSENQAAQKKAQLRITALEGDLRSQEGTGGTGYDPSTGITRSAWTQADGSVKVTVTDADGNVIEEYTRNRRDMAKVQRDLDGARAELEALKTAEKEIAAEKARLQAKEQVVANRLDEAVKALAECLETRCHHLVGLRLNDVAEAFGLGRGKSEPQAPKNVRMIDSLPGLQGGPVNGLFQTMMIDSLPGWTADARPGGPPVGQAMASLHRFVIGWLTRPAAAGFASRNMDSSPRLARPGDIVALHSAAGSGAAVDVAVSLVATGGSTGPVLRLQVVNHTGTPLSLGAPEGLVLQPLKQAAQSAVQKLDERLTTQSLNSYCLDFAKLPPAAGTLYRVADQALQQHFAPIRNILRAGPALAAEGRLHPDSDPAAYLDATKQWAVWSRLEKWSASDFEHHFVERTRLNVVAARQPWTRDVEARVRQLVPNRWRDIVSVLERADR